MKAWFHLTFSVFLILILYSISGCKYDVVDPLYNQPFVMPQNSPTINSIEPASAVPGVNTIKILGANLDLIPWVYFDVLKAEIVEQNSTSIICRRPNLVTDSCTIKIVPQGGIVSKYGPYKIDPVYEEFGSFPENNELGAITVDSAGNLYVVERTPPFPIIKISSNGEQTVLADTLTGGSTVPTEAIFGPKGYLYIIRTNRMIQRVDPLTGEISNWHRYSSGSSNQLKYGGFDEAGYLYTGGKGTDLVIIAPDSTSRTSGVYPTGGSGADILAITVYNNYVYLSVGGNTRAIWKHAILGNGSLGAQELVLDLSGDGRFTGRAVTGIKFSADGKMYLATDSPDPLFISENGNVDFYYKNILPPYCKKFTRYNNYLFLIIGNTSTTAGQNWMVYRVDIGSNLVP